MLQLQWLDPRRGQLPQDPLKIAAVGAAGAIACALFQLCGQRGARQQGDDEADDHFSPPRAARTRAVQQPPAQAAKGSRIEERDACPRAAQARSSPATAPQGNASAPSTSPPASPSRPRHSCCDSPPGHVVRDGRTLVPAPPDKRRSPADFPSPPPDGKRPEVDSLWAAPEKYEWYHRRRDAHRWAWWQFTVVDSRQQIISVQHEYSDPATGLRFLVIPTLRLADAQFFDSVVQECTRRGALVLLENMHTEDEQAELLAIERRSREQPKLGAEELQQACHFARMRGRARHFLHTCEQVGGACVAIQYFHSLVVDACHWRLADPPLSGDDMRIISNDVNCREAFEPLCRKRERRLFSCVDSLLAEAADPEWQPPAGQRVVALPWNGRHCMRIERFLVQCRGMVPHPEVSVRRIIFDTFQTANMVREANREDDESMCADSPTEGCEGDQGPDDFASEARSSPRSAGGAAEAAGPAVVHPDLTGTWLFDTAGDKYLYEFFPADARGTITGRGKPEQEQEWDSTLTGRFLSEHEFAWSEVEHALSDAGGGPAELRVTGRFQATVLQDGTLAGNGTLEDGTEVEFAAQRTEPHR
eukprot:TRINITY_DN3925_c0_g2_i1.p1 TRINITY_DN3925_c0_g2~~TRINITY_DN3925_c0_g2_i1.p1  ORF type:complete len:618 (+),score=189.08 TRINITY_DN3925_c0_g2_i1:88-1854(+)